ncbi:hypothetical protein FHY15_003984 [Xanthomonas arboricola]|nr:hypothetical protein [Xanthomonas arboricola]
MQLQTLFLVGTDADRSKDIAPGKRSAPSMSE